MKLDKINGNTFFIRGGTNTGVYIFQNKEALIIDPGLAGIRQSRIKKILNDNKITIKYIINTHEHNDHYGGCYYLKNNEKNVCIMSSYDAKSYIERPELFTDYVLGGKTNNFIKRGLRNNNVENVSIDKVIKEGNLNLNNSNLIILNLKGHTKGCIGVLTPDKVLFVGDSLIDKDIFNKYNFLLLYDVKKQIDTLNKLKNLDYEYILLGHGKTFLKKEEVLDLINDHEESISKYLNQIRNYLKVPMNVEVLLKNILNDNNLPYNYKEYYFYKSSLISFVSYLIDLNEINYKLCDGELLYYTKK